MKLKTKTHTWKIGEMCQGGIITVEIIGKIIHVIGKEWDFSAGTRRSSDQSNAQEFTRGTIEATDPQCERKLDDFISNLSTSYHADLIIDWIKKNVKIETTW